MKKTFSALLACAACIVSFSSLAAEKVLYFYNWSEYIPTDVLEDFTKKTGIKVIYSTYDSNETMYAKLKAQGEGYDLVVPSTYFITKMRQEGMLKKLDHRLLTNFKEIDPNFLDKSFDPSNDYSIPYVWGATGIGINTAMLDKSKITGWSDLWDPKWKGQLMMTDDSREVFSIALTKLGYSPNSTNPKEIEAAYQELKKLMPNVLLFNSDFPANPYLAGETALGMLWNGSAYIAKQSGAPIEMIWPKQGTVFWMDSLAIPAGAKNTDAAYQMIDFLLQPENAAKIATEIGYPTPVKGAYPLLPKAFMSDPNVFPPKDVIKNAQWQDSVGTASELYETYYQKLKTN